MDQPGNHDLAALLSRARASYAVGWKPVAQELYDLCTVRRPRHDDVADVYTKVAIVGRVYSAGVARAWRGVTGSEYQTARVLVEQAVRIEDGLQRLGGRRFDDPGVAGEVVALHREVTNAIRERSGTYLTSFVSKYLHFHCPEVPIYDSAAYSAMGKLVDRRSARARAAVKALPKGISVYRRFVGTFAVLHERACAETDLEPSVKEIDQMLWQLG